MGPVLVGYDWRLEFTACSGQAMNSARVGCGGEIEQALSIEYSRLLFNVLVLGVRRVHNEARLSGQARCGYTLSLRLPIAQRIERVRDVRHSGETPRL